MSHTWPRCRQGFPTSGDFLRAGSVDCCAFFPETAVADLARCFHGAGPSSKGPPTYRNYRWQVGSLLLSLFLTSLLSVPAILSADCGGPP